MKIKFKILAGFLMLIFLSAGMSACDHYCNSCSNCTAEITSASAGETICLNQNINDYSGTCINNPENFNNKIFDCKGNIINGKGDDFGIYLDGYSSGKSKNTIKNCVITNFSDGISLRYSSNNTIVNNTANSNNEFGIVLYNSSNNTIINNTANSNIGVGTFIFSGIYLSHSSNNNTIAYNNVNLNKDGIYLYYSSNNNNITYNTINLNNRSGIVLEESLNNSIINNTISSNNNYGIVLGEASNNKIEGNEISNNDIGIYSSASISTINSNFVCNNTNLDFNSSGWLSSSGDKNFCDNPDGWNDTGAIGGGCKHSCSLQPILEIRKWASDPYPESGGTVTYYVRVRNTGTATAIAIHVTDSLQNDGDGGYLNYTANFSDCQDGRAINNKPAAGATTFNVTLPDLAGAWNGSGEYCEFYYVVYVEEDLNHGMYVNTAEVTGTDINNTILQSDNDEAYVTITCHCSALSLEVDRILPIDDYVEVNEDIVYNVTVWNQGNTPFASLDCWDEVDSNFETITPFNDSALEAVNENSAVSVQPVFRPTSNTPEGISIYKVSCIAEDSNGNINEVTDVDYIYFHHCITPYNDMYINSNTTFCSGTYNILDVNATGVIIINSSNVVLDCNYAALNGNDTGYGIINPGFDNVTIKNCKFMEYTTGIFIFNDSYSNFLVNNTLKNNEYGIFSEKSGSLIENNTLNSNGVGVKINDSYCGMKYNVTPDTVLFYYSNGCYWCNLMKPWVIQLEQEGYKFYWAEVNDADALQVLYDCMPILTSAGVPHFGCTSNEDRQYGAFSSINSMRDFADKCREDADKYNSTINSNMVCFNSNSDFFLNNSYGNSGRNNTCEKADGWSDINNQGCSFSCLYYTYTIHLKPGWNLISIPLEPVNDSLWHVLAPIQGKYNKVFTYKNGWSYISYYDGIWQGTLDKIESGKGYWIYSNEDVNLTVYGYAPDKNIFLNQGWSLVGWPSNETVPLFEALTPINNSYDRIFTYDQSGGWEYKTLHDGTWEGSLNVMEPGRGYWIYMEEEGVLQVQ